MREICEIHMNPGGYRFAWVGYGDGESRLAVFLAAEGDERVYLEGILITSMDDEHRRGPTGTTVRTGQLSVAREILTDSSYAPWRERTLETGYASTTTLPMAGQEGAFGAMNVYAAELDAFDSREIHLLTELAGDFVFVLDSLRMWEGSLRAETEKKHDEECS